MPRKATMAHQTISGCGWSRPAHSAGVVVEPAEELWVCVRPQGKVVRRPVTREECAACPHWRTTLSDEE